MTTLSFDSVISNLKAGQVESLGAPKELTRRWKWQPDLQTLERHMERLGRSVVCWKVSPKASPHESAMLNIIRRHTLTYTVLPNFPTRGASLYRVLDPHVITDRAGFKMSLQRMRLALSPSAWKLPVGVDYDKELNELLVSFANGDQVPWDVIKHPQYRWESAFVDLENEPFAIGVGKKGVSEPVFFAATEIRRQTGTLPSKTQVSHEHANEDIERRAKAYGLFLQKKISAAGLTQEQMAEGMAVSREQLNRVLNGHHFPRVSTLKKMAGALEVDVRELLQDPEKS